MSSYVGGEASGWMTDLSAKAAVPETTPHPHFRLDDQINI